MFYRTIRKTKRECWQNFLQGVEEDENTDCINKSAKDRCWTALKYTQPRQHSTTPAIKGPDNEIAVTMEAKETLIRAHAFPKPPPFSVQGSAHIRITSQLHRCNGHGTYRSQVARDSVM